MPDTEAQIKRTVLASYPKGHDLELHLSKVEVEQHAWIELRDYVPSKKVYMRCVTMPIEMAKNVGEGLVNIPPALMVQRDEKGRRKRVNRSA